MHDVLPDDYIETYGGRTICESARECYRSTGNFDWINRVKLRGDDLSEYKRRMSTAVSKAIMSNEDERHRRSIMLANMNRTPEARSRSSRITKLTSSRPDILSARSEVLRRWRRDNQDVFLENAKALSRSNKTRSRPEYELFELCTSLDRDAQFEHGLIYTTPASSHRFYQLDIVSVERKIAIEFDGVFHFRCLFGLERFERQVRRDREVNDVLPRDGYMLIRVSYDQWSKRHGFTDTCVKSLTTLLAGHDIGVHFIGRLRAGLDCV